MGLKEWLEKPGDFDEFLKQNRIAAKDIMPGISRVLASYQHSSDISDESPILQDLTKVMLRSLYDKLMK